MASKKRSGLGKGIGALISTDSPEKEEPKEPEIKVVEKIVEVPVTENAEIKVNIDNIDPNKDQPRRNFDDESLQELADSIKTHGIIQPLIVTKGENGRYRLIAGERRWRAARIAGLKEVPVIIKDYTDDQATEIALIENIQREDLNPIEEAEAYQRLMDDFGLRQQDVSERVSKSRASIANSLRLLNLDDRVKQMVADNMISSGHARALLAIENPDLQYDTAMKIFDNNLSVRETERLVKAVLAPPKEPKPDSGNSAVYHQIEESLKSVLGSKVSIRHSAKNKGKIEIDYYSADDLERIIQLLSSIQS